MNLFRKLFGGAGTSSDKTGLYFYVRPHTCQEVIRVRIDTAYDLTLSDDESTYYVVKSVRGTTYKCTRSAELTLIFDLNKRLQHSECMGGLLVTEADYQAWLDAQSAQPNP
jgi:hypothetical protein